jgi:excisionase family DNA binding protein
MMAKVLLTTKEVADLWNCSARQVYAMIERGQLPVVRFGPKLIRVHPDAVAEVQKCLTTGSLAPSSMEDNPTSGTSFGQMDAEAAASLRRRLTRLSPVRS